LILTAFAILAYNSKIYSCSPLFVNSHHRIPGRYGSFALYAWLLDVCPAAVPEPITAGVISALLLGEMLSSLQVLGGLLFIGSILLLQWKKDRRDP